MFICHNCSHNHCYLIFNAEKLRVDLSVVKVEAAVEVKVEAVVEVKVEVTVEAVVVEGVVEAVTRFSYLVNLVFLPSHLSSS